MEWHSSTAVAKRYDLAVGTIIGHIEDGTLGAINVARRDSVRRRYKSSDKHLAEFEAARENPKPAAKEAKAARRTIARPTKDYFAPQNADESPAAPVITPAQRRRQSEAARQALQEAGV